MSRFGNNERIVSAQESIETYESALHDPSIDIEELKGFIAAQALRVREKEPEQRSPIPGLMYQLCKCVGFNALILITYYIR